MKKIAFIFVLILVFIAIILYLPHDHATVVERIYDSCEEIQIIQEVNIDDKTAMTLYLNEKDSLLYCAITKKVLFFYKLEKLSGHGYIEVPHNLKQGDFRVDCQISWYNKGDNYVVFGLIKDNDVATVTYQDIELVELPFNGYRFIYGYGLGNQVGEYKLFDIDGIELDERKD